MKLEELTDEKRRLVREALEANGAAGERVLEVYFPDDASIAEELERVRTVQGMNPRLMLGLPLCWPSLLAFSVVLSPCGTYHEILYGGKRLVVNMKRTLSILTEKSLIISQEKITGNDATNYYYWGLCRVTFSPTFCGEIEWMIPLRDVTVTRIRGCSKALTITFEGSPINGPPIELYCNDAQRAMTEINQARKNLETSAN